MIKNCYWLFTLKYLDKRSILAKIADKITMIHLLVEEKDKAKSSYVDKVGFRVGSGTLTEVTEGCYRSLGGGRNHRFRHRFGDLKRGFKIKIFLLMSDVERACRGFLI